MSIKIGKKFELTKGSGVKYTTQAYLGGSIGIRGRIQSGESLEHVETSLYLLREGSTQEIEVTTDKGELATGKYRINELNWKKERDKNGNYELVFNIGLQRETK